MGIPAPHVNLDVGSGSHATQTAEILKRVEPVLLDLKLDLVLVVGDVNSTIAVSLAAVKLGIRVARVEAGLRSFDRTMPEEINRVLTDALADYLFVTEEDAIGNLLREGRPRESILTECNTAGAVSVAESILTITTSVGPATCGDFNIDGSVRHAPQSWPYISGDVQWTSLNFTYGTVEVRAQFPPQATGVWPAIWMLGANCQVSNIYTADTDYSTCPALGSSGYQEIDTVECDPGGSWCHFIAYNGSVNPETWICNFSVDTNWHVYTMGVGGGVAELVDGRASATGLQYKRECGAVESDVFDSADADGFGQSVWPAQQRAAADHVQHRLRQSHSTVGSSSKTL
jgi:hypothetical protein